MAEGDSGTTPMTFTVWRSGDRHGTSSVHYETEGVTATSGVDFAPASGMLSFPTGVTTRTLTVDVTSDRLDESDEVLVVNLSNPNGGHIVDGQGLGTITDDDSSPTADSQSATTDEDTALPVTLTATGDGDPLTYSIVNAPAHGMLAGSGAQQTYTPAPNYNGPDSFTSGRATESTNRTSPRSRSRSTRSTTRRSRARTPRCSPRTASRSCLCRRPTSTAISLTYSIVDQPAHGALSGSGASRTYTPDPNYNGPDSFTFQGERRHRRLEHGDGLPHCPAGERRAGRGQRRGDRGRGRRRPRSQCSANDSDVDGDALSVTSVGTPAHGTAVLQGDGTILYTPEANYNGGDSFIVLDLGRERRHRLRLGCAHGHAGQRRAGGHGQLGAGGGEHGRGRPARRDGHRRRLAHVRDRHAACARNALRLGLDAHVHARPSTTSARTRSPSRRTTAPPTRTWPRSASPSRGATPRRSASTTSPRRKAMPARLDAVFTVSISRRRPTRS